MWISPDQLEKYAEAGLTVVSIDYRLAPETKLPEIVTDVEDASSEGNQFSCAARPDRSPPSRSKATQPSGGSIELVGRGVFGPQRSG